MLCQFSNCFKKSSIFTSLAFFSPSGVIFPLSSYNQTIILSSIASSKDLPLPKSHTNKRSYLVYEIISAIRNYWLKHCFHQLFHNCSSHFVDRHLYKYCYLYPKFLSPCALFRFRCTSPYLFVGL